MEGDEERRGVIMELREVNDGISRVSEKKGKGSDWMFQEEGESS